MLLFGVSRALLALAGEPALAVTSAGSSGALLAFVFVATLVAGLSLTGDPGSIVELVAWLAIGAVVLGAVGWAAITVLVPDVDPTLGLMGGIAVGGGLGTVVRLMTVPEAEDTGESVTIETGTDEDSTPEPRPADLFEASPDPMVYYAAGSDSATALAVNPAYREAFLPDDAIVEGTPVADLLDVAASGPILAAIDDAEHQEDRVEMETSDGVRTYRVRVIPGHEGSTSGYVTMTPVAEDE